MPNNAWHGCMTSFFKRTRSKRRLYFSFESLIALSLSSSFVLFLSTLPTHVWHQKKRCSSDIVMDTTDSEATSSASPSSSTSPVYLPTTIFADTLQQLGQNVHSKSRAPAE